MSQGLEFNVTDLVVSNSTFGPHEIEQLVNAIAEDYSNYRVLREGVAELELQEPRSPASEVRLGICNYLLGRHAKAVDALELGDGGALAHFY